MNLRAYIKKPDTSGLSRLYIVFNYKGKHWIPTKIKLLPQFWDQEKQFICAGQPLAKKLNTKLTLRKAEVLNAIESLLRDRIAPCNKSVIEYLKPKPFIAKDIVYLSALLFEFAKDNLNKKARTYTRKFETIARVLDVYNKNIDTEHFTVASLEKYITYLIEEHDIMNNTIHDHVRKIRQVMDLAHKKGRIKNTEWMEFSFKYVKPKPFYLKWEEVLAIEAVKPDLESDIIFQKEWLLRVYNGLRWSDVNVMKPHHFIKENSEVFYDYTMIKTKLDHNILMSKKANDILAEWSYSSPRLDNNDCNARIKVIANKAGLTRLVEKVRFKGSKRIVEVFEAWQLVTTHTARRTFARRWVDNGGDLAKLSKYLGHSSIEQTSDYVGYATKEVNDELRRIMD